MEDSNKELDKQAIERYSKEYTKEAWKFIFAKIGRIVCDIWIFIEMIHATIYWFKNDQLTNMQFFKYICGNYWYLLIILAIDTCCCIYCNENRHTLESYRNKLNKMQSEYKQKYEVAE